MITLKIADYCHGCSEFEPGVARTNRYKSGKKAMVQTVVHCIHERRCQNIKAYIEKQSEKEGSK